MALPLHAGPGGVHACRVEVGLGVFDHQVGFCRLLPATHVPGAEGQSVSQSAHGTWVSIPQRHTKYNQKMKTQSGLDFWLNSPVPKGKVTWLCTTLPYCLTAVQPGGAAARCAALPSEQPTQPTNHLPCWLTAHPSLSQSSSQPQTDRSQAARDISSSSSQQSPPKLTTSQQRASRPAPKRRPGSNQMYKHRTDRRPSNHLPTHPPHLLTASSTGCLNKHPG